MTHTPAVTVLPATKPKRRLRGRRWLVHSSGRFDRGDFIWAAALKKTARKGSVITGTEAAGRKRWLFNDATPDGWAWAHLDGAAQGESYACWDTGVWELATQPFAVKLTDMTWVRSPEYGGGVAAKTHALVVHLKRRNRNQSIALVVVHMPLDNTSRRAAAWVDCCRGLVELHRDLAMRYPHAKVVIVGDVNKNLRERGEAREIHDHLEKPLDMMNSWRGWVGVTKGGTHGRDLIDMAFADVGFITGCELLPDGDDSDHRPFRYRLRRR